MVMRIMVLVALLGHSSVANSQYGVTYPVDINAMLTPPYGTCLTDYVGTNRFQCNVLMRDMHATGYKFRILMTVKDMASGRVMFSAQSDQHTVTPGKPVYMAETGVFSEFFKAGNILSSTAYRDGCLNEGAYNFVFQVVDDNDKRRIPISKECVFPARLQAGGAPLLISPFTGTNIDCNQTIVNFSWQMPVVTGEQTKYLIEICPTDEGGNGLHYLGSYTPSANGSGPSQGYIHATSYMPMYQLIETEGMKLVPNTTYFWRVSIIDEFGNVKPNSTSEIDSFTYCYTKELEPYVPLKEPLVKAINSELDTVHIDTVKTEDNATKATWFLDDVRFKYQSYALDIRKKSQDTWTTYHIKINEGDTEEKNYYGLSNLKYNEPYEARMQYLLITDSDTSYAPFSDTITFVVPNPMDTADCGEIMAIKDCNGEKGRILKKYDTLYANGTPVVLDSIIYKAGDSTVISGFGVISFPILRNFKLKMSFNEVSVNCYGELVSGQVVSVYKESTGAIIDLNHSTGKGDGGGSQSTTERPDPTSYKDENEAKEKMQTGEYAKIGDFIYTKDKDGNVVALGKTLSIPADNYTNNNTLDDDDVYCIFRNDTKDAPYIGFDADEHKYYRGRPTLGDHYTPTFSKQDGADFEYIIPYVASNPGRVVKLSATLEGRLTDEYDKESLKFIMPMSGGDYLDLNAKKEGDKFIVDFPGGKNPDTNSDVYAIVKKGEKYVNVGKINIETYAWRTQKVKIVPVVNDYGVDENAISETLNRIYGRFGITYEVTKDDRFESENINSEFLNNFSVSSGTFTKQSDDMKRLQYDYKAERGLEDSTAYIFLLKSAVDYPAIDGDMPQGQICGYIFMHSDNGTLSDGRLVAHELAHGIYRLDHVFEKAYGIPENSTDNLLDYNNGDQLAHFQWELIKNPGFAWALLESDEENMAFEAGADFVCIDPQTATSVYLYGDKKYCFYSADGTVINLPKDAIPSGFYSISDPTVTARGALGTVKIGDNMLVELYYKDKQESAGYGFVIYSGDNLKEKNVITYYTMKELKVTQNIEGQYVQRVYVNPKDESINVIYKKFFVDGDECKIGDEIGTSGLIATGESSPLVKCERLIFNVPTFEKTKFKVEKTMSQQYEDLVDVKGKTADEIVPIVNSVSNEALVLLDWNTFKNLFEILSAGKEGSINNDIELAIIKMMRNIDVANYNSFFSMLKDDNYKVLKQLVSVANGMDDDQFLLWGDLNYTEFMKQLVFMYRYLKLHNLTDTKVLPNMEPRTTDSYNIGYENTGLKNAFEPSIADLFFGYDIPINYRYQGYFDHNTNTIKMEKASNVVTVSSDMFVNYSTEDIQYNMSDGLSRFLNATVIDKIYETDIKYDPFDCIRIVSKTKHDQTIVEKFNNSEETDDYYYVPAVFFQYLRSKNLSKQAEDVLTISFDALSMGLGVGELAGAAKLLTKARYLLEISACGAHLVSTATLPEDNEIRQCVELFNCAVALVGIKNIGKGIYSPATRAEIEQMVKSGSLASIEGRLTSWYLKWNEEYKKVYATASKPQKALLDAQKMVFRWLGCESKAVNNIIKTKEGLVGAIEKWGNNDKYKKFNIGAAMLIEATLYIAAYKLTATETSEFPYIDFCADVTAAGVLAAKSPDNKWANAIISAGTNITLDNIPDAIGDIMEKRDFTKLYQLGSEFTLGFAFGYITNSEWASKSALRIKQIMMDNRVIHELISANILNVSSDFMKKISELIFEKVSNGKILASEVPYLISFLKKCPLKLFGPRTNVAEGAVAELSEHGAANLSSVVDVFRVIRSSESEVDKFVALINSYKNNSAVTKFCNMIQKELNLNPNNVNFMSQITSLTKKMKNLQVEGTSIADSWFNLVTGELKVLRSKVFLPNGDIGIQYFKIVEDKIYPIAIDVKNGLANVVISTSRFKLLTNSINNLIEELNKTGKSSSPEMIMEDESIVKEFGQIEMVEFIDEY